MHIRDRVKELRRVRAGDLLPHPRNWRTHPAFQRDALRGVLAEVGYADALLARELPGGALQLVDGHLRAETTPDMLVPVLVLDVNEQEAEKLLAALDPLANLAGIDGDTFAGLVSDVETASPALRRMFEQVLAQSPIVSPEAPEQSPLAEPPLPDSFDVIAACEDESQQRELYERLVSEGFKCRLAVM